MTSGVETEARGGAISGNESSNSSCEFLFPIENLLRAREEQEEEDIDNAKS